MNLRNRSRLRRRSAAVLAATALSTGLMAAAGVAAPAYADEGDAPLCYASTGSITVYSGSTPVTSVPYGTNLTVAFSVNAYCNDYALYIEGPGFGSTLGPSPYHDIWATPPSGSHTMTWTMEMLPLDASSPQLFQIASRSITVT